MSGANHPPQPPTNTGTLLPVGASRNPQPAEPEFGISVNQLDNHRNNFFDVIERVQFFDGDGVLVSREILNIRGLIVQIVHHDDSPRTVIVMIGDDIHMMPLDELGLYLFPIS